MYSSLTREVDPDGKVLSIKYYNISGSPVLYANDYAEVRYTYDLAGRQTSASYYDLVGNLKLRKQGYAKKTTVYNEMGNVIEEAYYDTEDNLTDTTMKYAVALYTYDGLGNLTSESYLNTLALNVVPEGSLYAYSLLDYDDRSRLISEEYYDDFDRLAPCRGGYAAHYITYAESGHIEEEYYLDMYHEPIAIDGFSNRILLSEDEEEQTYVMRLSDESADEDAYVYLIQKYDRHDRPIETSYFDGKDNPTLGPELCCKVVREYTSRGQVSLEKYYDAEGAPTMVKGCYGIQKEYTAYAKLQKETWLDGDGNPSVNSEGYASILYDYDLSNAEKVEKYFLYYLDAEDNRCAAQNGAWGVSTLYYPVTLVHEVTFLDENGKAMTTTDGYAIMEYEEDENGNVTWEGYYDKYHAQTNSAKGYCSREAKYDSEGRLISERYLDRYNKLTNNSDGVAGWNGYYNSEGKLIITNRYDEDRKALPLNDQ